MDTMLESKDYDLQPGDRATFVNRGNQAVRIRVVTACSTEMTATLHPGATLEMVVGNAVAHVTLLDVETLIDTDVKTVHPDATLGDLTKLIRESDRNMFSVVDEDGRFIGAVDMHDVRGDMFDRDKYDTPISNYIIQPLDHVTSGASMKSVMQKFKNTGYYNLPVIDNGIYKGWVSRAHVFDAYRKTLIEVSEE
jgi:CBS domain-containing protein